MEIASEGVLQLFTYLVFDFLPHDGNLQEHFYRGALDLGKHGFADDFLDDERHGDDDARFQVAKGGEEHIG